MLNTQQAGQETTCHKCKGLGRHEERLQHHATCDYKIHIVSCDMCNGGGVITEEIRAAYYRSFGIK